MLYQLLHWAFGWDYIAWQNSVDQGISRVMVDHTGAVWFWKYRAIHLPEKVSRPSDVLWLTCHPSKYLPEVSND